MEEGRGGEKDGRRDGDGDAAVQKLRNRYPVKLADTTGKRNGHPYLKILPDWFEECCFRVMYGLYAVTSYFFTSWLGKW